MGPEFGHSRVELGGLPIRADFRAERNELKLKGLKAYATQDTCDCERRKGRMFF